MWNVRKSLAVLLFVVLASIAAAAANKPNIIYILADDLGYGDLSCYGQQKFQTPHIDKLAEEGIKFTDHYAGSTVCAPSRCSLMTGLHTGHCRIRGNLRIPLEPQDVTVAELLQKAGYKTALIGKWGLGEPDTTGVPTKQGFDYFFGYLNQRHAHNYYPEFLWKNEQIKKLPNVVNYKNEGSLGGVSTNKEVYSNDLFITEAINFMMQNRTRPFFVYLALTIPHANNEAGDQGMEVPDLGEFKDKDWPAPQKGHAAMITRMDRGIGQILELLEDLKLADNTIVMFSSDNGPHAEGGNDPDFADSNGPLRGIKRDLYEGGIRVPLLVRWPDKVFPGSISGHVSAFWDVMPTLAQIAGTQAPNNIDGISFLPTLLGETADQKEHSYLYWEFHEQGGKQAVRIDNWKGIRLSVDENPDGPIELYDLSKDIAETRNIADQYPEVVEEIKKIMKQARTPNPDFEFAVPQTK